jgi:hypothetical protein
MMMEPDGMIGEEKFLQQDQREDWLGGEAMVRLPRRGWNLSEQNGFLLAMAFAFGAGMIIGGGATMLLRRIRR